MSKHNPTKGKASAPAAAKEPSVWSQFVPPMSQLNTLKAQNRTTITQDVAKYMANPAHHPDITAMSQTSKTTPSYKHIDGFEKAPLYQSSLVHVETNMKTRIGGRGLIATADIQPGTLLLCEYIRHPFEQNVQADDGTPVRSELEFIQQFCFDMKNAQRVELLSDLASLFPFVPEDIEPDHKDFLKHIYGDFLEQCLGHLQSIQEQQQKALKNPQEYVIVTEDVLLRLICIVHFNSFPSGILLHTSMINHNCQPNTVKLFIPRAEIAHNSREYAKIAKNTINKALYQPKELSRRVYSELRATTLIKKGEEIYISYIPSHLQDLTVNQRQSYLHRQFRFLCSCELCTYETGLLKTPTSTPFGQTADKSSSPPNSGEAEPIGPSQEVENEKCSYEFDSVENEVSSQIDWIDQLTRNYINFTTGQSAQSMEQQHEAYLKATQEYKRKQAGEEIPEDDIVDEVELNDESLMSFRDIYGLPSTVNVQIFILLQAIPILYPYLFQHQTTTPSVTSSNTLKLHQLFIKCHKLILMVTKHLLEHIQQDLSIDTLSLVLYLYMLLSPSNHPTVTENEQSTDQSITTPPSQPQPPTTTQLSANSTTKQLLPWSGLIQFSTVLSDHFVELHEDPAGIESALNSCNNNGTKYLLQLTTTPPDSPTHIPTLIPQGPQRIESNATPSIFSQPDNWTQDKLLQQTFQQLSRLILPSDIITSHPLLVDMSITTPKTTIVDTVHLDREEKHLQQVQREAQREEQQEEQESEKKRHHIKIDHLLRLLAPITSHLLGKFAERTMGAVHLTISTIGLISALFNAKYHTDQHQLIYSQSQPPHPSTDAPSLVSTQSQDSPPAPAPITPMSLFNIQISTTYNDMLFNILYFLQNILPHHANASKIFRLPVFRELIGKAPADANRFAEALEQIHFTICDLYNNCPIETLVKGI